jgi:general secretion pathway protein G
MKLSHNLRGAARRHGFSLAELMVVIVIIGLLATTVVPKVMDRLGDAKWGKVRADLSALDGALTQYFINNGRFPDTLEPLVTADTNGKRYLAQTVVPKDPWGNEYVYEPPVGSQPHVVRCLGRDGVQGGEGDDRDLSHQQVIDGEQ